MNRKQMIEVAVAAQRKITHDMYYDDLAEAIVDSIIAAAGDEDAVFHVRKDAPDTSRAVSEKMRAGTLQADVLQALINKSAVYGGATDDELERFLGRSHQSVSGARNALVRKGYAVDSGERRMNSHGNMAIVWYYTGKEVQS